MVIEQYKGFELKAYEQIVLMPYKQFVCMARKNIKNKTTGFNVEGNSIDEVIQKAKERINENDDDN